MVDVAVVTQAQTAGSRWMLVSCFGIVYGSSGSAHYFVESYRTYQNQTDWGCRHLHGGKYNHSLRKQKDKGKIKRRKNMRISGKDKISIITDLRWFIRCEYV